MNTPGGSERLPLSRWTDLDGPVHYVDYGGPSAGPLIVCVHGLGRSEATWADVAPSLALTCRVLAIDLAGFGSTRGTGRPVTMAANQALLHRFLLEVAGTPAILVGHSMGGTIAAMQASEHPETVAGLVLINPAVPWLQDQIDKWWPDTLGKISEFMVTAKPARLLRQRWDSGVEQNAARMLRSGRYVPQLSARIVEQYRASVGERGGNRAKAELLLEAARSLTQVLMRREEFATMLRAITAPVLWLHGDRDPVIPIRAARAIVDENLGWSLQISYGSGHAPQLDAPRWTSEQIAAWLCEEGKVAAVRARTARKRRRSKRPSAAIVRPV